MRSDSIRIETMRCILRPFKETDLDEFLLYRNDPGWMRHQGGFKGLSRQAYADVLLGVRALPEGVQLAVADRRDGHLLGDLYLKLESDVAWIGYTINPADARKGFASEAVSALLDWLRSIGVPEVRAAVAPENLASIGLLKRIGFTFIELDAEGEQVFSLRPEQFRQ